MKFFKVKTQSDIDFSLNVSDVKAIIVEGNVFHVILKSRGVETVKGVFHLDVLESFLEDHGFISYDTVPIDLKDSDIKTYVWINPTAITGFSVHVPNDVSVIGEFIYVDLGGFGTTIITKNKESFLSEFNVEMIGE
jgi:hypothetical protein